MVLLYFFLHQIDNLFGMLDHLYAKFDKAYYAGLCKAVAVGKDMEIISLVMYPCTNKSCRMLGEYDECGNHEVMRHWRVMLKVT